MSPSSGEGRETPTLLGPLERAKVSPSLHLMTEAHPVSETSCFLVTQNSGRLIKSINPAILSRDTAVRTLQILPALSYLYNNGWMISFNWSFTRIPHRARKLSFTTLNLRCSMSIIYIYIYIYIKSMVWVRERTISTERPPLVGEVIANLCG
jgi:hypothetical protein